MCCIVIQNTNKCRSAWFVHLWYLGGDILSGYQLGDFAHCGLHFSLSIGRSKHACVFTTPHNLVSHQVKTACLLLNHVRHEYCAARNLCLACYLPTLWLQVHAWCGSRPLQGYVLGNQGNGLGAHIKALIALHVQNTDYPKSNDHFLWETMLKNLRGSTHCLGIMS